MRRKIFLLALLACGVTLADELWSGTFEFSGAAVDPSETTVIYPTGGYQSNSATPLPYNSGWAKGTPESIEIFYINEENDNLRGVIYYQESASPSQGVAYWDYIGTDPAVIPRNDTYTIYESVLSDYEEILMYRSVTIVPEPAAALLLGLVGAFFMRKRIKSFLVCLLALTAVSASLAEVTSVSCFQAQPFNNKVVINYTLSKTTEKVTPVFTVSFAGKYDDGDPFDLEDNGTITGDGAAGIVLGEGSKQAVWTPGGGVSEVSTSTMQVKVAAVDVTGEATYLKLDLSSNKMINSALGPENPNYDPEDPESSRFLSINCKTSEIWFRRVEPGTFTMGSDVNEVGRPTDKSVIDYETGGRHIVNSETEHSVTITKAFYLAVFETTQDQYETIFCENPSRWRSNLAEGETQEARPVDYVSYNDIRGGNEGGTWPEKTDYRVDDDSFFGRIRFLTGDGIIFDLPTEAQWEMACRDKGDGSYVGSSRWSDDSVFTMTASAKNTDDNLENVAWYANNTKVSSTYPSHEVGLKKPNGIGLYDMLGNTMEWCLDWSKTYIVPYDLDPVGPPYEESNEGQSRRKRGGSAQQQAYNCRIAERMNGRPNDKNQNCGFRIAIQVK